MNKCHVCGSSELRDDFVSEVFQINGKHVLVEHIPAKVCHRCGEMIFSRETTETIRRLLHGKRKPKRTIKMNVFEYDRSTEL